MAEHNPTEDNNTNVHKAEIIRWANCPAGTEVWTRHKNSESKFWYLVSSANWNEDRFYIVNDDYASVRKMFTDGKSIEAKILWGNKDDKWSEYTTDDSGNINGFYNGTKMIFRIKPDEPVYYWEWELKEKDGIIRKSIFMTDKYVSGTRFVENGWRKVKSSKRTWEE